MAKKAGLPYDDARYFLVRSKWYPLDQLNQERLNTIFAHKGTAPKKNGVIVFDDSGCPKRYAQKMEGVAMQYCGVTKQVENCLVAVFATYADKDKHFPIYSTPYKVAKDFKLGENDPCFKSKIAIAMEFIKSINCDPRFPTTDVADSWYAAAKIIELENCLGRTFISTIKSDRCFLFHRPDTKRDEYIVQDELVKLVKQYYPHKLKPLERRNKDGKTRYVWLFEFKTKLKGGKY